MEEKRKRGRPRKVKLHDEFKELVKEIIEAEEETKESESHEYVKE